MPKKTVPHPTDDDHTTARFGPVTEDKLEAALRAAAGATCTELALAAGIGRSTAAKILARWATENRVARATTPARGGTGRPAEHWALTDPTTLHHPEPAPAAPTAGPGPTPDNGDGARPDEAPLHDAADKTGPAAAGPAPGTDQAVDEPGTEVADDEPTHVPTSGDPVATNIRSARAGRRLPAGGLRGMVEDYLRERPDTAFGPSQIGKDLHRSSGAVANALVKLADAGCVLIAQDRPLRYTLAPPETSAPTTGPDTDADA